MPSPSVYQTQGQGGEFSYFDVPLNKSPKSPRKSFASQQKEQEEREEFSAVFEEESDWTLVDKQQQHQQVAPLSTELSSQGVLTPPLTASPMPAPAHHLYDTHSPLLRLPSGSQQIHPFPRPYSLPHSSSSVTGSGSGSGSGSNSGSGASNTASTSTLTGTEDTANVIAPRLGRSRTEDRNHLYDDFTDNRGYNHDYGDYKDFQDNNLPTSNNRDFDRSSSASLPLPAQIPFHTLPKVGEPRRSTLSLRRLGLVAGDISKNGEVDVSEIPEVVAEDSQSTTDATSSSGSSSSGTLPSTPHTRSPSPPTTTKSVPLVADPPPFRSPPTSLPCSGSRGNPNMPSIHYAASQSRPSSTFSNASSTFSYDDDATALRRRTPSYAMLSALSSSSSGDSNSNSIYGAGSSSANSPYPPPEPPTILPQPSPPYRHSHANISNTNLNSGVASDPNTTNAATTSTTTPPAPVPRITNASDLPPVLPPSRMRGSVPPDANPTSNVSHSALANAASASAPGALASSSSYPNHQATSSSNYHNAPPPYAPFLSHMPPPADSWIEVETTPSEYRLNIRLPGFKRDGM